VLCEASDKQADTLGYGKLGGIENQAWSQGRLVGRAETGELAYFTSASAAIKALNVATFAGGQVSGHIHLKETVRADTPACLCARGAQGRNQGHHTEESGIGKQFGHFSGTPNIFTPVGLGKAEVPAQALPQVIAVQHTGA
jgi:hypothetical protein